MNLNIKIRYTTAALLACLISYSADTLAASKLYKSITELPVVADQYDVLETKTGIDLKSKATFENSKDEVESAVYFELEGPLVYKQITDEQKAIFTIADLVEPEVDPTFQAASEMYPGLGLRLLDINSTVVATLEYKLNHEPDSYVRRAIIYTDKGLYTFSVTMHQSQPDSDAESLLELILRVAVDSGEL